MPVAFTPETQSLRLSETARSALLQDALARDPEESCGILIGGLEGEQAFVLKVVPAPNIAEDRRRSFRIADGAIHASSVEARDSDLDLIGFYHSHPSGPAAPSLDDVARATGWPGMLNIIIGIGDAPILRAWRTNRPAWREIGITTGD